ncbi:hypothetical protein [Paenibacillus methanolicus]|uniref:Uncharacterized protein n=1 Tax=Paenibacillus methanolicus TaxID=582686 RepID=A0A5S5CAK6_9BACL|nr:hypothetical protein [Paenibacillus methanolicus]TYP76347.1 hypothetical protein BCM02_1038 [Paenibacillus methanolicus]
MPNFGAFGNINHPLTVAGAAETGSNEGVLYYATTNLQNVGPNGFLVLQVSNPTTANRAVRIVRVQGGGLVNSTLYYVRNGTLNGGVALSAFNGNFGFSDVSQMIPSFSTSTALPVTGGATLSVSIQTTGTPVNDENGRLIIPPGGRFLVVLQKNVAGTNAMSIAVSWTEF